MSNPDIVHLADRDFWGQALADGRVFAGFVFQLGTTAQYTAAQILNPSGSGKVVYLFLCRVTPSTASLVKAGQHNTALSTSNTTLANVDYGSSRTPVATLWSATKAAPAILASSGHFLTGQTTSVHPNVDLFSRDSKSVFVRLEAGQGFITEIGTVNTHNYTQFVWAELDA